MVKECSNKNIVGPQHPDTISDVASSAEKKMKTNVAVTEDMVTLNIPRDVIDNSSRDRLKEYISLLTSPLFIPRRGEKKHFTYKNNGPSRSKIGFFSQQQAYYTGGRYYSYMLAVILSQYADVTFITDQIPPFIDDFKGWGKQPSIVVDENFAMDLNKNEFDQVIAVPFKSAEYAHKYTKKWEIPLVLLVFETPNFILDYRDGQDASEKYWTKNLKDAYKDFQRNGKKK